MVVRIVTSTAWLVLLCSVPFVASANSPDGGTVNDGGTLDLDAGITFDLGRTVTFSLPSTAPKASTVHVQFQVLDSSSAPAYYPDLQLAIVGAAHFVTASWPPVGPTFAEGPTDLNGTASADIFLDDYGIVQVCATVGVNVVCHELPVPSPGLPSGVLPKAEVSAAPIGNPVALTFQLVDGSNQPVAGSARINVTSSRSDCLLNYTNPTDSAGHSGGHISCPTAGPVKVCSSLEGSVANTLCVTVQFLSSSASGPPTIDLSWVESADETVSPLGPLTLQLDLAGVPLSGRSFIRFTTNLVDLAEVCWEPATPRASGEPCPLDRVLASTSGQYLLPLGAAGQVKLTATGYANGDSGQRAIARAALILNDGATSANSNFVAIPIGFLASYVGCTGGPGAVQPLLALSFAAVGMAWRWGRRRRGAKAKRQSKI